MIFYPHISCLVEVTYPREGSMLFLGPMLYPGVCHWIDPLLAHLLFQSCLVRLPRQMVDEVEYMQCSWWLLSLSLQTLLPHDNADMQYQCPVLWSWFWILVLSIVWCELHVGLGGDSVCRSREQGVRKSFNCLESFHLVIQTLHHVSSVIWWYVVPHDLQLIVLLLQGV